MIENIFNVVKDSGCIQVCIEPLDDVPDTVRFQVSDSYTWGKDHEEYSVDCSLELDELEYLAKRILDVVEFQRRQQEKQKK